MKKKILKNILNPCVGDVWRLRDKFLVIVGVTDDFVHVMNENEVVVYTYQNYIASSLRTLQCMPEVVYVPVKGKLFDRAKFITHTESVTPTEEQLRIFTCRKIETATQKGLRP